MFSFQLKQQTPFVLENGNIFLLKSNIPIRWKSVSSSAYIQRMLPKFIVSGLSAFLKQEALLVNWRLITIFEWHC